MTSQITSPYRLDTSTKGRDCSSPKNVPTDYCRKLKNGIQRLRAAIQADYEKVFPEGRDRIARAIQEAEQAAWATPFPSLFFPALAHLRLREVLPTS